MKKSTKPNTPLIRFMYSITAAFLPIILLIMVQPKPIFALSTYPVTTAAIPGDRLNFKVTFIELGSVKCIPCKKMQPVMRSIEKKYGSQVKVVFHDVWTAAGKEAAKQFVFDVIPTQIFLDQSGKEYFRHEGFFPEKELVKVLMQKGVHLEAK